MPQEDAVLGHPARIIDVVEAVRSAQTGAEVLVADAALGDFPGVALDWVAVILSLVLILGRPFRVGAAVAGFAGHAAVSPAETVKLAGSLGKSLVNGGEGGGRRVSGS